MTPITTAPKNGSYLFERTFVCLAVLSPIAMVIVAGMRPQGTRGTLIVTGHEYLVAALALAAVLRVVYLRAIARRASRFSERVRQVGRILGPSGGRSEGEHRYG